MKRNLFFAIIIFTISSTAIFGQNNLKGKISGSIIDFSGKLVEFATITLLRAKDSILVKGILTDEKGYYELENVNEGNYIISVSQIGYEKTYSNLIIVDANHLKNKIDVKMVEATKNLNEVVITAQKPFIEQHIDKMVVNVENSLVSVGSTAIEVLERSPGITVDNNGNISLKGKQNVRIMIDGKPTYLSAQDLSNMLKNMSANQIEKIEIMTNPSSKYDAAGNAGIINIVMKKNQNMGLNGSVSLSLGQGVYPKQNAGLNLNYRKNKINLFGNYNQSYRQSFNTLDLVRNFRKNDSIQNVFRQKSQFYYPYLTHTFKAGADFFATKKTTIGILINGTISDGTTTGSNTTDIYNGSDKLLSSVITNSKIIEKFSNYTSNINYKHTFDSTGRELTIDVDYARFNEVNNQNISSNYKYYNGKGDSLGVQRGDLPSYINIFTAKADYVHPINKKSKFETGWKLSYVNTDSDVKYFISIGDFERNDTSRSNHFQYEEHINAAYTNYNIEHKKFTFQFGLRAEQTLAYLRQLIKSSSLTRTYFQVFPTVFIRQKISKNHSMVYSYSRRIDRPNYQDLNPFTFYIDPYTYQKGNSYLRPQLTNLVEVSHTYKDMITTTLNYSRTNYLIIDLLKQNDAKRTTFQTKDNLGTSENLGIAISAPIPIFKWWNSNNYVNVFYNHYFGSFSNADTLNSPFDRSKVAYTFNSTNTFTIGKGWSAELSGFYQSSNLNGTITFLPMYMMSAGIQKQVFNKKGSIKLNIRDMFNWQRFRGNVNYQNIDAGIVNHWDNRVTTLSFNYRFGKSTVAASRNRKTGLEDEKNRVKSGGN